MQIGVLALQGGFSKHKKILNRLNINPIEVKYEIQLNYCDALIIPGGESTTISKLLKKNNLINPIKKFSITKPMLGTCAGLIIMSKDAIDTRVENLNIIDVEVKRNSWGRQISSFSKMISINKEHNFEIEAIFIRAPKIIKIGNNVKVLSELDGEPVFINEGIHYAATFHPELTNDTTIHKLFIESFTS